jgi:sialic acid synthase SpsE
MFALMRGARIIEKHFTLEKSAYGPDHALSMNPEELLLLSQFRDELKKLRN